MSAVVTADGADAKVVSTLQARAALSGFELVRLADETFIISKLGMFRMLEHPAAVREFLRKAGVPE